MLSPQIREDLECVTGQRVLRDGDTLREVLARLDRFAAEENLPERLHHYLSRRSYVKALDWLDDPDMPHKA